MNETELMDIAKKSKKNVPPASRGKKQKMTFEQHFPNWMDFEPKTIKFTDIKELLEIEEVKWWSQQKGFYGYFVEVDRHSNSDFKKPLMLMSLHDYNKEYYGCMRWYVLGYISGDGTINLPIANGHMATHKAKCCTRVAESLMDTDLTHMPDEIVEQIYNEMGWAKDKPICVCDCGFDERQK